MPFKTFLTSKLSQESAEIYFAMFCFIQPIYPDIMNCEALKDYISRCSSKNLNPSDPFYLLNTASRGVLSATLNKLKDFLECSC
jgi:hypothetical protein